MTILTYTSLREALASAKEKEAVVFAYRGGCKTKYLVGTYVELYHEIARQGKDHPGLQFSQVLNAAKPSKFYVECHFSCEFSNPEYVPAEDFDERVKANLRCLFPKENDELVRTAVRIAWYRLTCAPFSETLARDVASHLLLKLFQQLGNRYPEVQLQRCLQESAIFTGSSESRLSFQIVTPLAMDQHTTSSASLAYQLGIEAREMAIKACSAAVDECSKIPNWAVFFLQLGEGGKASLLYDLTVYDNAEPVRCADASVVCLHRLRPVRPHLRTSVPVSKKAGTAAQQEIQFASALLAAPRSDEKARLSSNGSGLPLSFNQSFPTVASWVKTLVQGEPTLWYYTADQQGYHVPMSKDNPWTLAAGSQSRLNAITAPMDRATKHMLEARVQEEIDPASAEEARTRRRQESFNDRKNTVASSLGSFAYLLFDLVILEDGVNTQFVYDLSEGTVIYCPFCESEKNGVGEKVIIKGIGRPHGKIIETRLGNIALRCSAGCGTRWCISLSKKSEVGMYARPVATSKEGIIVKGRVDVCWKPLAGPPLLAICADAGTGKTEFVRRILDAHPNLTVCTLSPRESLATFRARVWNLLEPKDPESKHSRRMSISLESIRSLDDDAIFDVVILDRADELITSVMEESVEGRNAEVHARLAHIMRNAKSALLIQRGLTEESVRWAANSMGINVQDSGKIMRKRVVATQAPKRQPIGVCDRIQVVLQQMSIFYQHHWDAEKGALSAPFVVFVSDEAFAKCLWLLFQTQICRTEAGKKHIRLVWPRPPSCDDWMKGYMKDPDMLHCYADVLITSPSLLHELVGLRHFQSSFFFLHAGPRSPDDEKWIIDNLRRPMHHRFVFAFLDKQEAGRKINQNDGLGWNETSTVPSSSEGVPWEDIRKNDERKGSCADEVLEREAEEAAMSLTPAGDRDVEGAKGGGEEEEEGEKRESAASRKGIRDASCSDVTLTRWDSTLPQIKTDWVWYPRKVTKLTKVAALDLGAQPSDAPDHEPLPQLLTTRRIVPSPARVHQRQPARAENGMEEDAHVGTQQQQEGAEDDEDDDDDEEMDSQEEEEDEEYGSDDEDEDEELGEYLYRILLGIRDML